MFLHDFFGNGSKGLLAGSDFANLEDLRNHVHPFDPLPFFYSIGDYLQKRSGKLAGTLLIRFTKQQLIPKRVLYLHRPGIPKGALQAGAVVLVGFGGEFDV